MTSPNLNSQNERVNVDTAPVVHDVETIFQPTEERPFVLVNPNLETLKSAQRLRGVVYADEKQFIDKSEVDPSTGIEADEDDDRAYHFVTVENGETVGNIRLITKSNDEEKLPVERMFQDVKAPVGSMEASRFIVRLDRRAKNSELLVSLALIRAALSKSLDEQAPYVYMTAEKGLYDHLIEIGIPFEEVSEPKFIEKYNSKNYAFRVDPTKIMDGIWEADRRLIPYKPGVSTTRPHKLAPFMAKGLSIGRPLGAFGHIDLQKDPKAFERNLGFLTSEEQEKIESSVVAVAGTGGDGGMLAVQLARLGVGAFKLADPEKFEIENINRQEVSSYRTIGQNKAEAVARYILEINPFAKVEVYSEGVNSSNVEDFVKGADLVIDETEFTIPEVGVLLARESRKQSLPVLLALNVGFGCYVTSFDPNGLTFEEYLGLNPDSSMEEISKANIPLSRWIGHIPSYSDLEVLSKVSSGKISAPSVSPGVAMASGVATTEAVWHILRSENRPQPTIAPSALSIDPVDGYKKINNTQAGFESSLGRVSINRAK